MADASDESASQKTAIPQIIPAREPSKLKSTPRTPQLASLLKGNNKSETKSTTTTEEAAPDEPFSDIQLQEAWNGFAEQRRKFQAEYQLLTQPYQVQDGVITVELLSPVHETMLNNIKSELTAFLREKLRNNTIQVTGKIISGEEKKIIYTNREKFDFLADKNPMLRELKDRLGLDTDF